MAKVVYKDQTYVQTQDIQSLLDKAGIPFEVWPTQQAHGQAKATDEQVLSNYTDQIDRLKSERGYVTADVVQLNRATPNLEALEDKFRSEHHHSEDEVRFTIAGSGVFEIADTADHTQKGEFFHITTEPGDMLIVPAKRRHRFYLTEEKDIACIRVFQTQEGWEAIFEREA